MTAVDLPGPQAQASARLFPAGRLRADLPLMALDAVLVAGCYSAALLLRFDGDVPPVYRHHFPVLVALALVAHLGANWILGLYRQVWRHASVAEARCVISAAGGATAAVLISSVTLARQPFSVVVVGGSAVLMFSGAVRFQSRLFTSSPPVTGATGLRVLIVGAGELGAATVRAMRRNPECGFVPVAVLDDDPRTHGRSLGGVQVVGSIADLPSVVHELGIHQVLLAAPSTGGTLVRTVAELAELASVPVRVVPGMQELIGGSFSFQAARELHIEDLLGRDEVLTDLEAVRALLRDKRVLITGAGGSIGSEITRQVALCAPRALVMLDHDETHLFEAAATVRGVGPIQVLADIRNPMAIRHAMRRHRPDIIFHAAAHKHVPVLENHPCEAVATNITGTRNLIQAARGAGVGRLVFVSTDKAVSPTSVMGASKWIGEQLVLEASCADTKGCAVRFGNVAGSRGSVIPTFARQIAAGGPVTVTDPAMTRYFMSVQESAQLVLQAAALAEGGEVFMLDMGSPVNILGLAERMIRLSGRRVGADVDVVITGARPGEKLEESLRAPNDIAESTSHNAIIRLRPASIDGEALRSAVAQLDALARARDDAGVASLLFDLVGKAETRGTVLLDLARAATVPAPAVPSPLPRTPSGPLVLLAAPCPAANAIYHSLSATFGDVIVVMEPRLSRAWVARRRARRLGWMAAAGQILFGAIAVPALNRGARRRVVEITRENDLDLSPIDKTVLHVPSVNTDDARRLLADLKPSVVVVCGTRVLDPATLGAVDTVFLNVHAGVAPQYRGVHGGYWALVEGRRDMAGTTVHVLDAGIDTGPIVGQSTFAVTDDDSFVTYPYLHLAAGMPILTDAVKHVLAGDGLRIVPPLSPDGPSRLRSHPTLWGYVAARVRHSVR